MTTSARARNAIAGSILIFLGVSGFWMGAASWKQPFFLDTDLSDNGIYYSCLLLVIPGAALFMRDRRAALRVGLVALLVCVAAVWFAIAVKSATYSAPRGKWSLIANKCLVVRND